MKTVTCDRCKKTVHEGHVVVTTSTAHGDSLPLADLCRICALQHVEWLQNAPSALDAATQSIIESKRIPRGQR